MFDRSISRRHLAFGAAALMAGGFGAARAQTPAKRLSIRIVNTAGNSSFILQDLLKTQGILDSLGLDAEHQELRGIEVEPREGEGKQLGVAVEAVQARAADAVAKRLDLAADRNAVLGKALRGRRAREQVAVQDRLELRALGDRRAMHEQVEHALPISLADILGQIPFEVREEIDNQHVDPSGRRTPIVAGVRDMVTGCPTILILPREGVSISVAMPRWRTCGSTSPWYPPCSSI